MRAETLPGYLQRGVEFLALSSASELSSDSLADSVVLLWIRGILNSAEQAELARAIVRANPLAVHVCGERAGELFDELLERVSRETPTRHMMTSHSEGDMTECLEDLFFATWPAQERFDAWTRYKILAYGQQSSSLKDAARNFLEAIARQENDRSEEQ